MLTEEQVDKESPARIPERGSMVSLTTYKYMYMYTYPGWVFVGIFNLMYMYMSRS